MSTGGYARGVSSIEIGAKIYALVASDIVGLEIIDVSDSYNPVLVGSIIIGGALGVSSIEIGLKIYAFLASFNAGLKIVDVSDP